MRENFVWCPHCRAKVMLIIGATLVRDAKGQLVLKCPHCDRR